MPSEEVRSDPSDKSACPRYQVRLPGFITDEDLGLGDVLTRTASAVGLSPCGGCARRAADLNRWLVFSGRRPQ